MIPLTARRRRDRFLPNRSALHRVDRQGADFIIRDYLEALDCPRALSCWLLYKHGEHRQLVEVSCNPDEYVSTHEFRAAYAASKFLSKCVGLQTGIDLKGVALDSAEEAECTNRSTNQAISAIRDGHASDLYGPEIFRAIQIIANILGPCPSGFADVGWSAGRSSSAFGKYITGYHKYRSSPDTTVRGRSRALQLLNGSGWWGASVLQADAPVSVLPRALRIIPGNTLITVPKSAKTDRVICYEPHMNIRLQLGVGDYLRSRLRKAGVNLDDQSINRRRAKLGSIHGKISTIDLKSASDTVARELVWELLPIDWACLLDDLRSHNTIWPDGSIRRNEKFSSMGNGFTFELESLLFYALASAVSANVSVYGDDIVVPTSSFGEVARLLTACGFTLNRKKSFSTGYFRESCGGDYFSGVDCTPVYLRSIPKSTSDVVKLHNQVRKFASVTRDRRWALLLKKWRTIYPGLTGPSGQSQSLDPGVAANRLHRDRSGLVWLEKRRPVSLVSMGDGHYHVNFDEAAPVAARQYQGGHKFPGFDGWVYTTRVEYMEVADELEHFAPAICMATGPKRTFSLLSAALKQVTKYKNIRGLAIEWPDVLWE